MSEVDTTESIEQVLQTDAFTASLSAKRKKDNKSVLLNLDPTVVEFFKAKGKGHITRMQDVLTAYVNAASQTAEQKAN